MSRIVITGMGVVSAIGNNVSENRQSLAEGKCGIGKLEQFESKFASLMPVGEVKLSDKNLATQLGITATGIHRTTLLATYAFNQAVEDSALSPEQISSSETAFVDASTVGGMCLTGEMYNDSQQGKAPTEYLSTYDYASAAMFLQQHYHLQGTINTINTACSSSANAIMFGARLIKTGRAKRAIVGGVDTLAKFTINGFNALHILSNEICRPFDEARKGLNLGEGAAFLVLEKEEDVPHKNVLAVLSGYGNANDAFHASSLSEQGDGPYAAMNAALQQARIPASDISFINAHGTGTENNDLTESVAMKRLFNRDVPFMSSKANTGHTLAAAGAIEAVYCILNLREQALFPAINFTTPITGQGLVPVQAYQQASLQHVMSNSFGFGGNCSSLIFSKA